LETNKKVNVGNRSVEIKRFIELPNERKDVVISSESVKLLENETNDESYIHGESDASSDDGSGC
jgi:hypothetical protein